LRRTNYPYRKDCVTDPNLFHDDATTNTDAEAILEHFSSLMRRVAGWHAPEFIGIDVTMSQAKALYLVSVQPGIGMSALAAQLGVGLSAVSGLVDRLVEHGYIERTEDLADRRQQLLTVTPAGAGVVEHIRELNAAQLRKLLDGFSAAELGALRTGISALDREARLVVPSATATAAVSPERNRA
jgi:DNA-binding MarR family transcriptional regulator